MAVSKKQFINGSIWKIVEQFGTKGITLIVSIVLSRLLDPDVYGVIALTAVFTSLSDILIDGGFSTALIRKKEVDDTDYSSVLVISFGMSFILYITLFICAPYVAVFYDEPRLTKVLRILGLMLFIQAFSAVRVAVVNRNMQFKLLCTCNFLGAIVSGIIGIVAAYMNMGVWALVIQRLTQLMFSTVFLFIFMKWKIHFKFDFKRIRDLLTFSIGVVSASLINFVSGSLYSLIVGKQYSMNELGYSDKGNQLPQQLSLYTFGAMSSVLLPTLSSYQNDMETFKRIVRKVVQMTTYLITPMMVGLALVSREVIILLFSKKWEAAAPLMQSYCLYYWATPIMLISVQVFFALGKSFKRVKTEVIRMIMQVTALLAFVRFSQCSVTILAYVCAGVAVLSAVVALAEAMTMIHYRPVELFTDMSGGICGSVLMGICIWGINFVLTNILNIQSIVVLLGVKIVTGVGVYILFSLIFRLRAFAEIWKMVCGLRRKHA